MEAPHVFVEEMCLRQIAEDARAYQVTDLRQRLRRLQGKRADSLFAAWTEVWLSAAFRPWDIRDCLANITCPVLHIQGAEDPYGTRIQMEEVAARVAGPFQGGHSPHRDQPEATRQAMRQFLTSQLSAPS